MDGADIRLTKDLGELDIPPQCKVLQTNGEKDLKNIKVTIKPDSGPYKGIIYIIIIINSSFIRKYI